MSPIPKTVRVAVAERSGGICERCHAERATHVHHRKLQSQGGRHELANLLHLSARCHDAVHRGGDQSYDDGYLVRRWAEPANIPVHSLVAS